MGVTTATTHKQPGGASVTVGPVRPIATTYGEAARLSQTGISNALRVNQAAERGGEEAQRKIASALATYRIEDGEPSLPGAMLNSAMGGMLPSRRMAEAGREGAIEQFAAEGGKPDERRFDMRWGPYRKPVTNQDLIRGAGYAGEFVGAGVYGGPVGRAIAPVGSRVAARVGGYAGELAASGVENAVGNAALGFAEGATVGVDERGGSLTTGLKTAAQDAAVGAVAGPVLKGVAEGTAMIAREGMGAATRGLAKLGQQSTTVTDNLRALAREADLGDPIPGQLPAGEVAVGFPSLRHLVRTKQATIREQSEGRWVITFKGDQPLALTASATDDTFFVDWLGPADPSDTREMSPKQLIKAIAAIKSIAKDVKAKFVASQPINESVMRHMALHGAKWEPPPPGDWEMLPVLVAPAENIIEGRKAYANFVDMQQRDPELWATLTTDPHAQEAAFAAYNQKHGMDPFGRVHAMLEKEYGRATPGSEDYDTPIGMDEDFDFDAYSGLPWEAAKRQWQKIKARLGARGDPDPKYRAQDNLARLMTRAVNQTARFTMDHGKVTAFDMAAVLTGDPNFIAAYSIAADRDLFKLIRAAEVGLARAEDEGLVPKGSWRNMQALLDEATGKSLALRGRPSVVDDMKTRLGGDIPTKGVFKEAGRSLLRIGESQRAGLDEGALSSYAGIPWNELKRAWQQFSERFKKSNRPAPKDRDAMLRDGQNLRGLLVDRLHEVEAEFERTYDGDYGDSKNTSARLDALFKEQNEIYEALGSLDDRLTNLRYSGSQREAQFRHDADEMLTRAVEEEKKRKGEPVEDPVPEQYDRGDDDESPMDVVDTPDGKAHPVDPFDDDALVDAAKLDEKRASYRKEIEESKARLSRLEELEMLGEDVGDAIEEEMAFIRQTQAEIENIGKRFDQRDVRHRRSGVPADREPLGELAPSEALKLYRAFGKETTVGPVRESEANMDRASALPEATPERMFGRDRRIDPARLNAGFPLDEVTKLGVDAIRGGKRKLVEWRKAVETKMGKPFETWKAARTAHAEAMAAHRALYNRKVVNTSKLEADLDPTGAEYVQRKLKDVNGKDLQKSLKMTAEEMRAEVDKAVQRLSDQPDIFDVDKARASGGAEVRARLEKFLANGKRTEAISERLKTLSETDPEYRELQEEFAQLEAQSEALIANYIVGASQKGRDLAYQRWQTTALKRSPDYWVAKAKLKAKAAEVPWTSPLETEMRALAEKFKGAESPKEQAQLAGQMNALLGQIGQRGIGMQVVDLIKTLLTFPGPIDVANFSSNSVAQTMTMASDHFAATIDWMLSAVHAAAGHHRPRVRTAPFKLTGQQDEAVGRGLRQGAANALIGLKHGSDPEFGGKFGSVGKFDLVARARKQLGKSPDNPVDAAVNGWLKYHWNRFGAADAGFRYFAYEQYLLQEARRMALNEGLKGARARARADEIVAKPPADIAIAAIERARYVTFTDDNKLADIVTRVKSMSPPGFKEALHTFIPFVKTVANVVDFSAFRHTPGVDLVRTGIGNAMERRRMGRRHTAERATAEMAGEGPEGLASKHEAERKIVGERLDQRLIDSLGRQATGASIIALGAYLRSRGLVTGSGPRTAQERDTYEARGQSAYAIRDAQGNWINYHRLAGPAAPMLALGADLYDFATKRLGEHQAGMTEAEKAYRYVARPMLGAAVEGAPGGHFTIFGRALSSEPEVQALANPAVGVTSPGKTWARAFDPYERRTDGVGDRMKANIPGLRQTLPPKRDAAGRVIPNIERGLDAFVGTGRREAVDSPVFEELDRLGIPFSRPGAVDTYTLQQQRIRRRRGETDKRLPEEYRRTEVERDDVAAQQGPELMRRLERLVGSSAYRRLPDEMKRRRVESVLTSIKQREDKRRSRQLLRQGVVPEDSK